MSVEEHYAHWIQVETCRHPFVRTYCSPRFGHILRGVNIIENKYALLERMQNTLFCLGGFLALDEKTPAGRGTSVPHEETEALECAIDRMEKEIPPVHAFVLPGGSEAISRCHICRTVCRRLERHMTDVFGSEDRWSEKEFEAMQFVNRLSDFLFILSKKIAQTEKKEFFLWKI